MVKSNLVSVFVTRVCPDLDAGTLCDYLTEKLGKSVTCRMIDLICNRFSSFYVTAECNKVADMYDPQLWPAGICVCCYFEARRPRVNRDSVAHGSGGEFGFQQQRSVAVSTPVALQGSSCQADGWNEPEKMIISIVSYYA